MHKHSLSGAAGISLEWVFVCFSIIFLTVRIYVKWIRCKIECSDFFVILAFLCLVACTSMDTACFAIGGIWTPHIHYEPKGIPNASTIVPDTKLLIRVFKMFYIYGPLFYTELWCIKIAIILLYHSMINGLFPKLRITLHMIMTFTITGYLTTLAMNLFWCTPISNNWTLDENKICWSGGAYVPYFTGLGFHFISDLLIFAWPFFLLKYLHLSRNARLGVIGMFALGAIDILCTVSRAISIGFGASIPKVNAWQGAEMAIAIMVVCCPAIKLLCNDFSQRKSSKNVTESGSGGSKSLQLQKENDSAVESVNLTSVQVHAIDNEAYMGKVPTTV